MINEESDKSVGSENSICPQCGTSMGSRLRFCSVDGTPLPLSLERTIPHYEFIRLLGSGGMGVVYEGRHIVLNKSVAIKMLTGNSFNTKQLARFQKEGPRCRRTAT